MYVHIQSFSVKIISMSSGSINTHAFCSFDARKSNFGHNVGHIKVFIAKKYDFWF